MVKLPRNPGELWTSYLVRRLHAEGFVPDGDNFEKTNHKTLDVRTGKLELQVSLYTPESIIDIKRGLPILEEMLRRCSTYAQLRKSSSELQEEVRVVETGTLEIGDLSLKFQRKDLVTIECPSPITIRPLAQYQPGTTRKAREVIDDLIGYIKVVGVQQQEPDFKSWKYEDSDAELWKEKGQYKLYK